MALELNTNQTTWAEAANEINNKALDKRGDTMDGALRLSQSPTNDNEATRKDYVDNYQKPWNIAANVEKINSATGYMSNTCSSTTKFSSMSYSIIMKNSGILYLEITVDTYDSYRYQRAKEATLEIYINDVLQKEFSVKENADDQIYKTEITVNKGDIVKVLEKHKGSEDDRYASVDTYIDLLANFETPYIYLNALGVSKKEA